MKTTLLLLLLTCQLVSANTFRGIIKDYRTGEPLEGVQVAIPKLSLSAMSDKSGEFEINEIPDGLHIITISKSGYSQRTFEEDLSGDNSGHTTSPKREFELRAKEDIESLDELARYILDEITVLTTRASADHPVTYDNLTGREIQERNSAQDLPVLLTEMPGINAYSDGGNGVGYSYLRMRGFSQNRIAAQINGVPLNDALSHEVFWIDLPDFAEDLADLQVQRGIGSSLYGPAALGGSINLATKTPGVGDAPKLRTELSYGSWNTRRASLQFNSGRIQRRYGFSGRLTRMETDGYRNGAWAELWSYNLTAARFTNLHTTRAIFYGGPEKTHLAYEGVSDSTLKANRKFNPLQYPGEIDNFFQPHYELHDEWRLSPATTLYNSLYTFRGDGYYDQFRPGSEIVTYVYDDTSGGTFDVLRRRNIGETDWGFVPRLTTEHKLGTLTLGAESRIHHSHHEGFLLWAKPAPQTLTPDYKYYDYRVRKQSFSGYVHELLEPTPRLRLMLDLQAQSHRYELYDDQKWSVTLARDFSSFNPRFGALYELIKHHNKLGLAPTNVYVNFSMAQREPAFADLYDPQDYYSLPISAPNRFRPADAELEYIGPVLKPEKLSDLELGFISQAEHARLGVAYYHMNLRDEIIPYAGQLDDNGVPVSGNADKTLHAGLEFVGSLRFMRHFDLDGSLTLADHRFIHYREFDWGLGDFVARDGNRLPYDAQFLGNLRLSWTQRQTRAAVSLRTVGRQFIDNSENDDTAVPEYQTVQLDLAHRLEYFQSLRALDIQLRIANLLHQEYESFGYSDYTDGTPRYIPAAPRSAQLTVGIEF